jgi:TonB family protein
MGKFLTLCITVLVSLFSLSMNAQTTNETVSMKPEWKPYILTPTNLGVSLPKFPTVIYRSNACESWERYIFAAFADDAVYTVAVTREVPIPDYPCGERKKFGRTTLDERISQVMDSQKVVRDPTSSNAKYKERYSSEHTQIVFVDDPTNKRFIELWIQADKNRAINELEFFDTFTASPKSDAIVSKGGVISTIGDDLQRTLDASYWKATKPDDVEYNFRILHKPQPIYTEEARKNNYQGVVRLKVTLLASGAVGTITPIKTLRYGLTEEAIRAARRMVFIPKKVKGYNQSVVVTVEYGFSIY